MSKTVTLRLTEDAYRFFRRQAEVDHRSLSNLIVTAAQKHIESAQAGNESRVDGGLPRPLTARRLLASGLVGTWKNKKMVGGSAVFARRLRLKAQKRD